MGRHFGGSGHIPENFPNIFINIVSQKYVFISFYSLNQNEVPTNDISIFAYTNLFEFY